MAHGARNRTWAVARKPFRAAPPRYLSPVPGRNEPCPCGSGKKFKRCCVDAGPRASTLRLVEQPPEPLRVAAGFHALDEELVKRLLAFAKTLDGFAPLDDFPIDLEHQPEAISIFVSWAVYEHSFAGPPSWSASFARRVEPCGPSRKQVKAELETLLKELERSESRLPEEERFDVAALRSELAAVERPSPRRSPLRVDG